MRSSAPAKAAGLVSLFGAFAAAIAQSPGNGYPLFADDRPLELTISGPLRTVFSDADERAEHPAAIEWTEPDGSRQARDFELRIRGRSRTRVCGYPPLSLDFPRGDMTGTVFEGQNRIKLVVLCSNPSAYEDYLAQEFLIYRMFNVLTERSFRVRWAQVEYVDTERRRSSSRSAPAFLIEADWEVAERLGMELVEEESIDPLSLDGRHTALLMLFSYLIGNTDLGLLQGPVGEPCCHNGKLVREPGGQHIFIPYDFDSSGLIAAEYAVPSPRLPIRSVTDRHYRGFCPFNASLAPAIELLNARREQLLALFDSALLSGRARRLSLDYLNESYEIINDPAEIEDEIVGECRPAN